MVVGVIDVPDVGPRGALRGFVDHDCYRKTVRTNATERKGGVTGFREAKPFTDLLKNDHRRGRCGRLGKKHPQGRGWGQCPPHGE
jgi:hypothetical protein